MELLLRLLPVRVPPRKGEILMKVTLASCFLQHDLKNLVISMKTHTHTWIHIASCYYKTHRTHMHGV